MFTDRNGLITTNPYGNTEENSILYTVELFVVQKLKGLDTLELEMKIEHALIHMHIGNGIYKQNPDYPAPKLDRSHDRFMSHDQLTAIMTYFKLTEQEHRIAQIMKNFKYGISYDNTESGLFKPFHPRDLIFYHILNGSKIAFIWMPLLYLITIYCFMVDKKYRPHGTFKSTDGELLYYMKRSCTKIFKPVDFFCELLIKIRFGNWDNVFSTYFKHEEHPLNLIKNK